MTKAYWYRVFVWIAISTCCFPALAQQAASLKQVQRLYVGSLGTQEGADELRRELIDVLRHTHQLHLASSPDQADAVIVGKGELWIRGYHSLSPRARVNPSSAEPIYGGYLSVKVQGRNGETLWSYLANPGRISFGDLKHVLASQLVSKLTDAIDTSTDSPVQASNSTAPVSTGSPLFLRGTGATFPAPIYQDWLVSFHASHPGWHFEYKPTGSGAGIEELIAGNVDFAGSDIPPRALQPATEGSKLKQFPSVGGAVVLIYNLPGFGDELRLTPDILADILARKIKMWNDPSLRALNRRSPMPNAPIQLVHRTDSSGTTFALTSYLAQTSESWKASIGAGQKVNWPAGKDAVGNDGVAKQVAATSYSLGYVEFIYAFEHRLSFASIRNAAGRFIQADLPSITAAANSMAAEIDDRFDISITNATAAEAYPISTFTWLVFRDPMDRDKRAAILSFLEWVLTSGQAQCSALGYAPLPKRLIDRELAVIRTVQ